MYDDDDDDDDDDDNDDDDDDDDDDDQNLIFLAYFGPGKLLVLLFRSTFIFTASAEDALFWRGDFWSIFDRF